MPREGEVTEPAWGEGRDLDLGWPEPIGSLGIDRRLQLLGGIHPLERTAARHLGVSVVSVFAKDR